MFDFKEHFEFGTKKKVIHKKSRDFARVACPHEIDLHLRVPLSFFLFRSTRENGPSFLFFKLSPGRKLAELRLFYNHGLREMTHKI